MRRTIGVLGLFLLLSWSASAQEVGDIRLQGGGDYRIGFLQKAGTHVGVEYFFADMFSIAPTFTVWFPEVGNSTNVNVDLRYYLTRGISQVYIMGGYNNYWINLQPGDAGLRQTRPGANFGLGAFIRATEQFGFNTQFSIQSQNQRAQYLRVGVVYQFSR
ncbi:hypothetical protein A3SI_11304 [Nitritalea halalkaliphila LW7]|uniref:Outer membrane protein beta-barrel domain-containing protein n=1 Tax=Nitritalea halalkaliphila LW7 TaxID=1189621 RepID=I5C2A8_9BACT|nr:hypothetical protein [Nitritalea halalkaliphila]EIM75960.1 hypothetical protein A3SI_11304 [Nitritalea halalkaliphila LW7]